MSYGSALLAVQSPFLRAVALVGFFLVSLVSFGGVGCVPGEVVAGAPGAQECSSPAAGCPCNEPGVRVACGEASHYASGDESAECQAGTRVCSGGVWGACSLDGPRSIQSVSPALKLQGAPSACANNPCDPTCTSFVDNAGDIAPTAGVTPTDDGGITLDPEGTGTGAVGAQCKGLQCQIQPCASAGGYKATKLVGSVYDPAGKNPLPNVLVYIPNGTLAPLSEGVSCEQCAAGSGDPLVSTTTDAMGRFKLSGVPSGSNVPLVIQSGKWRRTLTLPPLTACAKNDLSNVNGADGKKLVRFPKNRTEGNIPRLAFVSGNADPLQCVLMKMGLDTSAATGEFGVATDGGGQVNPQRVHYFNSTPSGANGDDLDPALGGPAPPGTKLWTDPAALRRYDAVLLACEGYENVKRTAINAGNVCTTDAACGDPTLTCTGTIPGACSNSATTSCAIDVDCNASGATCHFDSECGASTTCAGTQKYCVAQSSTNTSWSAGRCVTSKCADGSACSGTSTNACSSAHRKTCSTSADCASGFSCGYADANGAGTGKCGSNTCVGALKSCAAKACTSNSDCGSSGACESSKCVTNAYVQNLVDYASSGGRLFATHFSYSYIQYAPQASQWPMTVSSWNHSGSYSDPLTVFIDRNFPKGDSFAKWLNAVGASPTLGQLTINQPRRDFTAVDATRATRWMRASSDNTSSAVGSGAACFQNSDCSASGEICWGGGQCQDGTACSGPTCGDRTQLCNASTDCPGAHASCFATSSTICASGVYGNTLSPPANSGKACSATPQCADGGLQCAGSGFCQDGTACAGGDTNSCLTSGAGRTRMCTSSSTCSGAGKACVSTATAAKKLCAYTSGTTNYLNYCLSGKCADGSACTTHSQCSVRTLDCSGGASVCPTGFSCVAAGATIRNNTSTTATPSTSGSTSYTQMCVTSVGGASSVGVCDGTACAVKSCSADADCGASEGCSSGKCVQKGMVYSVGHCTAGKCTDGSTCASDSDCDARTKLCSSASDCGDSLSCVPASNVGLGSYTGVCSYGSGSSHYVGVCDGLACNPPPCSTDSDCAAGYSCLAGVCRSGLNMEPLMTFNVPVGAPAASQCGRVVFSDFHVSTSAIYSASSGTFPSNCIAGNLSAQEKALEYMIFDLTACISPDYTPTDPPPYDKPVTVTRDYAASCPSGHRPQWHFFDWKSHTPSDSSITLAVQTGETPSTLRPTSPALLAKVSGPPITTWTGVDVASTLAALNPSIPSAPALRVSVTLTPSTDKQSAPTLDAWRQAYDCVPTE